MAKKQRQQQNDTELTEAKPETGHDSKYIGFVIERIHRSQIKKAPYNPRLISKEARAKLQANLAKVGLVAPITWNRRTGNILGGHQRISCIDTLEGTSDYYMQVAVVDMDPKTEREENIFLNNDRAQGEFDWEQLEAMIKAEEIDYASAGWDETDIRDMFGDSPLTVKPEALVKMAEQERANAEAYKTVKDRIDSGPKDRDFYSLIVHKGNEERTRFHAALGLPEGRYIDSRVLWNTLKSLGLKIDQNRVDDKDTVFVDIKRCERCSALHSNMPMYPIREPNDNLNYWGMCPVNGEPVMAHMGYNSDGYFVIISGGEKPSDYVAGKHNIDAEREAIKLEAAKTTESEQPAAAVEKPAESGEDDLFG